MTSRTPTWYSSKPSAADRLLLCWQNLVTGLDPVTEFPLDQPEGRLTKGGRRPRPWLFDLAWPDHRVLVEVNGYGFGHLAIHAVARDAMKTRDAVAAGYRVVTYTSKCLGSYASCVDAVEYIEGLLTRDRDGYLA